MANIRTQLASGDEDKFDYIIVGGGTAGCVIARRLAEYLPSKQILVLEAGPSDYQDKRVSDLKNWIQLLGTELDYDYGVVDQPRGNSTLRQSRAKVLGGCSSHNGCVSLHTFEDDCRRFQQLGCTHWSFDTLKRMISKSLLKYQPVDKTRQNPLVTDWISACSNAFGVPVLSDVNADLASQGNIVGSGYMPISYDLDSGDRICASSSYIHPVLSGERKLPNLHILIDTWVSKINVSGDNVTGVTIRQGATDISLRHRKETILCAGAIDTPRLMLLSGLGPAEQLSQLSIPIVKDIAGVGENLQDHVEANLVWELRKDIPPQTATYSDSFFFYRRPLPHPDNEGSANIMFHLYTTPDLPNFEQLGYETPRRPLVIMPNVPRPRSRGRIYLVSADPTIQPAIDFRYFTDATGYDEQTIVDGIKMARKLAQTSPLKEWISREVAPGPGVKTDEEISEFGRKMSTTLFHPMGSTKMGDVRRDPMAVVDAEYRVVKLSGLRIADAGVVPVMPTPNPVLTVIAIAEHAAEVIAQQDYSSRTTPSAHL